MKFNLKKRAFVTCFLIHAMMPNKSNAVKFIDDYDEQFNERSALAQRQGLMQKEIPEERKTYRLHEIPDVQKEINIIASQEPVFREFEAKIPQMNALDHTLENLSHNLDHIVDNSDMRAANQAGNAIRNIYAIDDDDSIGASGKAVLKQMEKMKSKQAIDEIQHQSEVEEVVKLYNEHNEGNSNFNIEANHFNFHQHPHHHHHHHIHYRPHWHEHKNKPHFYNDHVANVIPVDLKSEVQEIRTIVEHPVAVEAAPVPVPIVVHEPTPPPEPKPQVIMVPYPVPQPYPVYENPRPRVEKAIEMKPIVQPATLNAPIERDVLAEPSAPSVVEVTPRGIESAPSSVAPTINMAPVATSPVQAAPVYGGPPLAAVTQETKFETRTPMPKMTDTPFMLKDKEPTVPLTPEALGRNPDFGNLHPKLSQENTAPMLPAPEKKIVENFEKGQYKPNQPVSSFQNDLQNYQQQAKEYMTGVEQARREEEASKTQVVVPPVDDSHMREPEPVIFKTPDASQRDFISTQIRQGVEKLEKSQEIKKMEKKEEQASVVKEAMDYAFNIGFKRDDVKVDLPSINQSI